jgi:hypothetical protein
MEIPVSTMMYTRNVSEIFMIHTGSPYIFHFDHSPVLKTLAISGSIIYASIVDHITLGGPMNESMGLSIIVVVIAILNYNFDASPVAAPQIKSKCSDSSDDYDDAHGDSPTAFGNNDGDAEEINK